MRLAYSEHPSEMRATNNAAYSRVGQVVGKATRMLAPSGSKAFIATQRLLREVECRVTENSILPMLL